MAAAALVAAVVVAGRGLVAMATVVAWLGFAAAAIVARLGGLTAVIVGLHCLAAVIAGLQTANCSTGRAKPSVDGTKRPGGQFSGIRRSC